jgi:endoglucanase
MDNPLPEPSPAKLPRWRGFNLVEMLDADRAEPFREEDFAFVAEHGFNFVRLPLSYLCWADPDHWDVPNDESLAEIDAAIELGKQYGVHVCLCFHRAPGYCVNSPGEALDLWLDQDAADLFAGHWRHFAARYKEIPNSRLSFNLLNEPTDVPERVYARVVRQAVAAIREADAGRLIIADGRHWGTRPCLTLADLKIAQSTRGYSPMLLTHYRTPWVPTSDLWPQPTWPIMHLPWCDRARLQKVRIDRWKKLEALGAGIHVGEFGAYNKTAHETVLAWMGDFLELWQAADWGWALWNLRGPFGVLDSMRGDVAYESWREHTLDRQMLELLTSH